MVIQSRRAIAWKASLLQGLLSGTVSTLAITLGAPRIGRARALDWMEIGTVLLGAGSVAEAPRWWHITAGVAVHQTADLAWAVVFFALGRRWTAELGSAALFALALPWALGTAAIEYYVILPSLQPLVVMQVPFWTALGVHVTSGLLYPFYPRIRALVTRRPVAPDRFARALRMALIAGFLGLAGLEMLARADREPRWPLASEQEQTRAEHFLRHMTAHHAVGVELARLAASNAGSEDLRQLGRLMVANQAGEIDILMRWWNSWTRERMPPMSPEERAAIPGMPPPGTIDTLSMARGGEFDAAFVPVMIAHHRGAVEMSDEAWKTAVDPRIRLMADSIRHSQTRQISAMDRLRRPHR